MSEKQAKLIKIISVIGGLLGALICAALGFTLIKTNLLTAVLFFLLAGVCLLLIYPLYQVGNLAHLAFEHENKLRAVANQQARLMNGENDVNKYSPFNKHVKKSTASPSSVSIPNAAERTIQCPVSAKDPAAAGKKETGDLTREFATPKHFNEQTGEITAMPSGKRNMTISSDTFEIHRKFRNTPRVIPQMMTRTIAAGGLHTVAVRYDGSVIAAGYGQYGQCNVSDWREIVAVCAGGHHTLGLRADGTCVAAGYGGYGQCDVAAWNSICGIAAGACHSVGLLENGTCVAVGDNTYGQCNVLDWTDIISVSANANYTVGLKADGTLIAVGAIKKGDWGAIKWSGICSVATGGYHTIGLKADGTCVAVGNNANKQCEVSRWTEISAIAAGNFHTVGLKKDGTVIAVGHNGQGQCAVGDWRDVIAIAAGRNHTVALTKNGNVLAAGENNYGQCSVAGMSDVKIIGI